MTLMLYDHRIGGGVPLDVTDPVVPVGQWFQVEAFYRNAQDATGRVTYWLDGRQIVDIAGQAMAPTSWVEWDAVSVGVNLTPSRDGAVHRRLRGQPHARRPGGDHRQVIRPR